MDECRLQRDHCWLGTQNWLWSNIGACISVLKCAMESVGVWVLWSSACLAVCTQKTVNSIGWAEKQSEHVPRCVCSVSWLLSSVCVWDRMPVPQSGLFEVGIDERAEAMCSQPKFLVNTQYYKVRGVLTSLSGACWKFDHFFWKELSGFPTAINWFSSRSVGCLFVVSFSNVQ